MPGFKGASKASAVDEDTFLSAVVQCNKAKMDIDWDAVAKLVGYKNGGVASVRFGTIKRRWGLTAGSGTGPGPTVKGARKRVASAAQPAGARKRVEKGGATGPKPAASKNTGRNVVTGKARGAKAKPKFVEDVKEEVEDDDEEEELDEEPRDLMAGSDDEAELDEEDDEPEHKVKKPAASAIARFEALFKKCAPPSAPTQQAQQEAEEEEYDEPLEESFEARVARGEYDDDNISNGRGGQLEQELSDYGLQQQIKAEVGQENEEDYDAYDLDAVCEDAAEEQAQGLDVLPGITVAHVTKGSA